MPRIEGVIPAWVHFADYRSNEVLREVKPTLCFFSGKGDHSPVECLKLRLTSLGLLWGSEPHTVRGHPGVPNVAVRDRSFLANNE
jgi:hypothetical protein